MGFFGDGSDSEILIFTELDEAMIVKFAELGLKFGDDLRRLGGSGRGLDGRLLRGLGGFLGCFRRSGLAEVGGIEGGSWRFGLGGGLDGDGIIGGDSSAHLLDDFGAVTVGLGAEVGSDLSGLVVFKNVGGGLGLGDELVADGRVGGGSDAVFDGVAFGVYDVGEEGETTAGLFLRNVFSEDLFNDFGGGDFDGGFTLAGIPKATIRLGIKADESGDVSLHGLVFS